MSEDSKQTFETVMSQLMQFPGVYIEREVFLRKELRKYCSNAVVEQSINEDPLSAGVDPPVIREVSEKVIRYESLKAGSLAIITSLPFLGELGLGRGTIAVELGAFVALVLRVIQQMAYLYGHEEFDFDRNNVDTDSMSRILVFMIAMGGCRCIALGIKKLTDMIAQEVLTTLPKKPLTKGLFYPIVKQIARSFGIRMNKMLYAQGISMLIPLAGGLASGCLTYLIFRYQCEKALKSFQTET
ncbi:MAG: hypothetical protein IJ088_01210 [Clostridia bacterium]|nr:hypothetical protein [Clostridia bacterium]